MGGTLLHFCPLGEGEERCQVWETKKKGLITCTQMLIRHAELLHGWHTSGQTLVEGADKCCGWGWKNTNMKISLTEID